MRSVSKMIRAKKILDLDKKITDGTVVIASDIHIPFQDKAAVKAFLSYVKEKQPEVIVLNGDVLDMFMLSRFTKGEGRNPLEEIKMCQALLATLRSTCPNSEIFYVIGNHECFDKRTEILAPGYGWVNIKDAVEGKIKFVTSYNMETGKLETSEVTNYHQSYCSELISIETCNTKQIVTPNHEVLINGKEKIPAYLLTNEDLNKKILPCAKCAEESNNAPTYTPDEIRLITWICTDGCIVFSKPRIQFKLSYPEKIQALKELLDRMNIPYTLKAATMSGGNKLQPYLIRVYGENARNIIKKFFNDGLKQFPYDFADLSEDNLKILLETIIQTDGAQKENRIYFYSSNKHNIDIVQEACVKNNLSCRVNEGRSGFNPFKKTFKAMITSNYSWVKNQNKIDVVPYNDFTYCLTTKLGTLVTRIDGKVAITGNCRLEKYVLNKAPELASLIEDVFSIIKVEDYNVRGCASLTINDNFVMKHGTYIGNKSGLSAIKEMENAYMSGATGHVHRLSTYRARKAGRKFVWIETGCLCDLNPEYCVNPNWCQGFAVVEFKDGKLYKADCLEIEKGKIL